MDVNREQRIKDSLALVMAEGLGPVGCHKLLTEFETPSNILCADRATLRASGLSANTISSLHTPDLNRLEQALVWAEQEQHHLISIDDDDYPGLLRGIPSAPIILFAIGQRTALQSIPFAIVGSRNPSNGGKKLAESFAYELAGLGLTICSGLALGIDYQSHCGALRADCLTIAVLGNGLNSIYPARHRQIADKIIEQGLLLSEFFPDTRPVPGNFPRRNRIISGLSVGVLVVEAAKKSGSLITAHYALEQGREVFAIPGSIHNPLARGTHSLIKQGAKLVEDIADILDEIRPLVEFATQRPDIGESALAEDVDVDNDCRNLLNAMGYEEVSVDYLVRTTGLTADSVSSMLSLLELRGIVESQHSGKYNRCS